MTIKELDAAHLRKMIDEGHVCLIDVRELLEYKEEHISKAHLFPLSRFDPSKLPESSEKKIVFYCLSGRRSAIAGSKWMQYAGVREAYSLKGGIKQWKELGFPTIVDLVAERKVERQAHILAGSLTLIGSLAAVSFSGWFFLIPVIVGTLQLYSGVAGHCCLSYLLSRLPQNR